MVTSQLVRQALGTADRRTAGPVFIHMLPRGIVDEATAPHSSVTFAIEPLSTGMGAPLHVSIY